jgi:GNAT superfamily N-acetyltransferase
MPIPDISNENRRADDLRRLLPIWVHGWTVLRDLRPPVTMPGGAMKVEVGLPDQRVRYVMPGDNPAMVEQLANELSDPATWLKICATREQIAPLLPKRWTLTDPRHFMHLDSLEHATVTLPAGYTLTLADMGAARNATIIAPDGTAAAKGRFTIVNHYAIFDTIDTAPAHQRKGLGRAIMQSLTNAAIERQANAGILVATEQGSMLYATIGWRVISSYTSAYIP